MPEFYVYCLFRLDGRPCYIGKGKGDRFTYHFKPKERRNPHLVSIIEKAGGALPVVLLHSGLDERTAFEYEKIFITTIGRELRGGPLVNLTDGGEGTAGVKFTAESRERVRQVVKAQWGDPEVKSERLRKQKKITSETKEKIRAAMLAHYSDPKSREKLRAAQSFRGSEEFKTKLRARFAELKEDPAWREKSKAARSAAQQAVWRDPEVRARRATGAKDPGYRATQSEAAKKRWEDPEFRAQMVGKITETRRLRAERERGRERIEKNLTEEEWAKIEKVHAYDRLRAQKRRDTKQPQPKTV